MFLTQFLVSRLLGTNRGNSLARTLAPVEIRKNPLDFLPRWAHKDCTVISHQGGWIMRIKTLAAFAMTLLLVALALNVPVAAADQQSGTWKMDPAKSTYSPGPAAKSITLKIESDGDNIKYSSDGIDASGNPTHVEY